MKQIVAKNRHEALHFCSGGRKSAQRVAYWAEDGRAYRFERLPGSDTPTWDRADGAWWSAGLTVRQKLGLDQKWKNGRLYKIR